MSIGGAPTGHRASKRSVNPVGDASSSWRPCASRRALQQRAAIIARIREFFQARGVLEVETPVLSNAATPAPYLNSFSTRDDARELYLHTSPELPMKRLLAAGSGPIFQLGKAFRRGEAGRWHNPEFTLLEWYRPGLDHHRLMDEVEALVLDVLGDRVVTGPMRRLTYAEAVLECTCLDPHCAPVAALRAWVEGDGGGAVTGLDGDDRDAWLDLVLSLGVIPRLSRGCGVFLYDYPATQAALARVRPGSPPLAERFELFVDGVELANGFHELGDAAEQRRRFEAELAARRRRGLAPVPLDERFLAALGEGMPDCAGVALGVDRLVMLATGAAHIREVLSFDTDRA